MSCDVKDPNSLAISSLSSFHFLHSNKVWGRSRPAEIPSEFHRRGMHWSTLVLLRTGRVPSYTFSDVAVPTFWPLAYMSALCWSLFVSWTSRSIRIVTSIRGTTGSNIVQYELALILNYNHLVLVLVVNQSGRSDPTISIQQYGTLMLQCWPSFYQS